MYDEILQKKSKKIKNNAVRALTSALLVLSMPLAGTMALADPNVDDDAVPKGPRTSKIEYQFVAVPETLTFDDEGRLLVWEATIEGDFTGEMKWWFVVPPPVDKVWYLGGNVAFYAARWEIWQGGELLLAGESAGKTVFPDGADGI